MNKLLPYYLFLVAALSACHNGGSHTHKRGDPSVPLSELPAKPLADASVLNLDSSMVALKTFRSISLEDAICQMWEFEDADKAHWNKIFWDSVTDTRQFPEMALFPDHSALLNPRCGVKLGTWTLDKENGEMSLQWKDGSADLFIVRAHALRQIELLWHRSGDLAQVRLKSDAIVHKNFKEDPYYPANNKWRVRPTAPESHEQIRRRVKDCVRWYAMFFTDNHNRGASDISFSGFPTCFQWYNGAIGMKQKNEMDQLWVGCFYNENQAFTAYDMVADELGKHKLKWPEHPTSWIKQTGEVLMQLANNL